MTKLILARIRVTLNLALVVSLFQQSEVTLAHSSPYLTDQDILNEVASLIQQAYEYGNRYLQYNDDEAKKFAKKNLERAEKLLKNELQQEPNSEKHLELLVKTYFYQAAFRFSKNFDECIKTATEGLERFPTNNLLAFFKGYAHYYSGDYAEAVKALNRCLESYSGDPQVQKVFQESQQYFLAYWNRHANFYQSPQSRLDLYNPQTYRMETVFQITPEWELTLGNQEFTALTSSSSRLDDSEIQIYLESLVSRLVSNNPGSPFAYKVTIINSSDVNAFATPGHIVVLTGLLAFVENESELVGVLAHELAHHYAHHQARAVMQNYLTKELAKTVVQTINARDQIAQLAIQLGANLGVELLRRAYSRSEEKEADLYAAHIMFNAGYNPTAASDFHLKMYKRNPKQPITFLSTHPPAPDRVTYLTDHLESFPLNRELQLDSQAFQKIKARFGYTSP